MRCSTHVIVLLGHKLLLQENSLSIIHCIEKLKAATSELIEKPFEIFEFSARLFKKGGIRKEKTELIPNPPKPKNWTVPKYIRNPEEKKTPQSPQRLNQDNISISEKKRDDLIQNLILSLQAPKTSKPNPNAQSTTAVRAPCCLRVQTLGKAT